LEAVTAMDKIEESVKKEKKKVYLFIKCCAHTAEH